MRYGRAISANCMYALRSLVAILCCCAIAPGEVAWSLPSSQDQPAAANATLSPQELDSLVAPIALYPDSLLSQALVASTYPLEIVQLQQWLGANANLKGQALADAAMKQPWDPSVQAMAELPDLVKQLAGNIQWTTDLGNAFLAQQKDVMDAVQRMRAKAQEKGNLKSTEQQKVQTETIEGQQVIVIQPSNPEVVYVPSYNPTVVYGAPPYPYPPITYPPPGYYAAGMALSFGVGMMMGAAWGGGGWGCGWGGNNNITINTNNNFVRNSNIQGGNRVNARGNGNTWQHNPQHRGGAPYSNRATADRFGGTARGDSLGNRQANARQNLGNRNGGVGNNNRGGIGDNNRGGIGDNNRGGIGDNNRGGAGNNNRGGIGDNNRGGAGNGNRGGGDRVGNRSVPNSSRGGGAFGGGSGNSARASSSRGASSVGGGARGGGGRGGGGRRR